MVVDAINDAVRGFAGIESPTDDQTLLAVRWRDSAETLGVCNPPLKPSTRRRTNARTSVTTQQKALAINLAAKWYGSFAEIGAGQEVGRWFFKVGGAAGTVAKTISAYDMAISDSVYGPSKRYVSRERLQSMLEREFSQVSGQLGEKLGNKRCFFAFADTVATRRFRNPEHGRGWIGVRLQNEPGAEPSQITLHAHLLDESAEREQEALGILGVNLLYGASSCTRFR